MASSANTELRADAPGPEKRGAGGKGRRGLPPYLDEGVPGLGLPFISAGSNCKLAGGGLLNSEDPLVSQDLVGDALPLGEYGTYEDSGGGMVGAVSMTDAAREGEVITVGWYDLRELYELFVLFSKLAFICISVSRLERGDLTGNRRDLLREGPSGILGNNCQMSFAGDFCSLQVKIASSSALRDVKRSEGDLSSFFKCAAIGR